MGEESPPAPADSLLEHPCGSSWLATKTLAVRTPLFLLDRRVQIRSSGTSHLAPRTGPAQKPTLDIGSEGQNDLSTHTNLHAECWKTHYCSRLLAFLQTTEQGKDTVHDSLLYVRSLMRVVQPSTARGSYEHRTSQK